VEITYPIVGEAMLRFLYRYTCLLLYFSASQLALRHLAAQRSVPSPGGLSWRSHRRAASRPWCGQLSDLLSVVCSKGLPSNEEVKH